MKAAVFDYRSARTSEEAVTMLATFEGYGKYLAGGQSLGPMLNLRLAQPALLVDVRLCEDLRFQHDEGESVVYGAALTHADFEDGVAEDPTDGFLRHGASRIAYRAVRNRGTLGGSLAHADPAADWLAVMMALDAQVLIRGVEGMRAERLSDFVRGPFETTLRASDLLVGVRLRKRPATTRLGYAKLAIKTGEFAEAFAVTVDVPEEGEARVCLAAIERKPVIIDGEAARQLFDSDRSLQACEELVASHLPGLERTARRTCAANLRRALRQDWAEAS